MARNDPIIAVSSGRCVDRYGDAMLTSLGCFLMPSLSCNAPISSAWPASPNLQGTVLEPSFRKFRIETVKNDAAAKAFLQQYKLEHYWDLAEASQES